MKKSTKEQKELDVLLGVVNLYLKEGKPIGSNTLKDTLFSHISSATIRNYFASLERKGFLKQHHISSGRIPTDLAFRFYAHDAKTKSSISKDDKIFLESILLHETKKFSKYFQKSAEVLSEMTGCATLIASPRFDQDFIAKIRLVGIDEKRALCILISDFSLVHTEMLFLPRKLSSFSLKRIEDYFAFRLSGVDRPALSPDEEEFAKHAYNEIILRHFISLSNVEHDNIYRAGFSKLLSHPEFHDPTLLSNGLSLFENIHHIRSFAKTTLDEGKMHFWIGSDLKQYTLPPHVAAIIGIPYFIGGRAAGVVLLLGPQRLSYQKVFGQLELFSHLLGENLAKTVHKFKLTYHEFSPKQIKTKGPNESLTYKPNRENYE